MTPEKIAELRKLEAAATDEPWSVEMSQERKSDIRGWRELWAGHTPVADADGATIRRNGEEWCEHGVRLKAENAAFIVALRNAAPALLEAAEEANRLRAELVRWKETTQ